MVYNLIQTGKKMYSAHLYAQKDEHMKISAINSIKYTHQYKIQNNEQHPPKTTQNTAYNPIYYTDYNLNVSFGKRSPEDFYAQDFNKNNMPETMEKYLNEKFAERSKIAPVQIMSEAYDDLRTALTPDDIKKSFPDEQFQKLRPANYSGATSGVLKKINDIKAMQDVPEPLFKDGCDDLTTYIVKKIYLEGKTVKEIDKDFAQDINEVYELAARVPSEAKKTVGKNESVYFSHSTLYNLGIRFPKVPFWNSFIATRDDYERTNRVRTITGEFVNADSREGKAEIARRNLQHSQESPKPRRYNFKRHKVKQISDNIVNSKGETSKALKKSGKNTEELTFLQKYWSQIMSVATEKVHLSDELIDFNNSRKSEQTKVDASVMDKLISGADLTSSETTPFKIFWNERTDLKAHFSNAITDTIILFSDEFGADGNNPRFQALLEYANGIKPEREARKLEHARIQAEYDKLAVSEPSEPNIESLKKQIDDLKTKIEKSQPDEFKYIIEGHEIILPYDIELHTSQAIENASILLPKKISALYRNEIENATKDDRLRFCLSNCIQESEETPDINKLIYSDKELQEVNDKVVDAMESKYNAHIETTRMALFKYAENKGRLTDKFIRENANLDVIAVRDNLLDDIQKNGEFDEAAREIQNIFKQLSIPLSNKEKNSCRVDLFQHLKIFDMNSSTLSHSIPRMIQLISIGINENQRYQDEVKSLLGSDFMFKDQGPVLRMLLDKKTNPEIKNMIRDHAYQHLLRYYPENMSVIMSDTQEIKTILKDFPTEMHGIISLAKTTLLSHKLKLK